MSLLENINPFKKKRSYTKPIIGFSVVFACFLAMFFYCMKNRNNLKELDQISFDRIMNNPAEHTAPLAVVHVYKERCPYCPAAQSAVYGLVKSFPLIIEGYQINRNYAPQLIETYSIVWAPTLLFFLKGKYIAKIDSGGWAAKKFQTLIEEVCNDEDRRFLTNEDSLKRVLILFDLLCQPYAFESAEARKAVNSVSMKGVLDEAKALSDAMLQEKVEALEALRKAHRVGFGR